MIASRTVWSHLLLHHLQMTTTKEKQRRWRKASPMQSHKTAYMRRISNDFMSFQCRDPPQTDRPRVSRRLRHETSHKRLPPSSFNSFSASIPHQFVKCLLRISPLNEARRK
ncbi:hypothetical protein L596_005853 [Steinernema carpocapsae]|uniref:Uncharacterized protein n=1 Tax=Steinernema carpocapsae TaxID=34508 RepID=A0A4U8V1S9_STECR|nr:hypothetical protein L596_005853 [Steinernema carpocapsae]